MFDPSDEYEQKKVLLTMEEEYNGYSVQAYCSPNTKGLTYLPNGEEADIGDGQYVPQKTRASPFKMDVVLVDGDVPSEDEMLEIREQLSSSFETMFEDRIDEVFSAIEESDDVLETIMTMEPNDLMTDSRNS